MQLNKPIVVVSIVLLLALGSTALVLGGAITRSLNGNIVKTGSNETQSSSTRINSGNTSSSFFLAMNVVPTIRMVPLGGSANFTVVLYSGGDLTGGYSLSAAQPGLSFQFDSPVAVSGAGPHGGFMRVSSSNGMSPGTYQVTIQATGSKGVANQTFDFHVLRNLVMLKAGGGPPVFLSLTVKVGAPVTWLSLDGPMSDDQNPWHTIIFLNGNLTSGSLQQYESWSHTFTQPGVYRYYDDGDLQISGEVVVSQ